MDALIANRDPKAVYIAIEDDMTETFRHIVKTYASLPEDTIFAIVEHDRPELLKFLQDIKDPSPQSVGEKAAVLLRKGLKYLVERSLSGFVDTCEDPTQSVGEKAAVLAARKGRLKCLVKLFLSGFVDTCKPNEEIIQAAAENGHIECFKFAFENGCRVNYRSALFCLQKGPPAFGDYVLRNVFMFNKRVAAMLACASKTNCIWCYEKLIQNGFRMPEFRAFTGPVSSMEPGDIFPKILECEHVSLSIDECNEAIEIVKKTYIDDFRIAVEYGDLEHVREIKECGYHLDPRIPLVAIRFDKPEILDFVLSSGCSASSAVEYARKLERTECLVVLAKHGLC